MKRGVFVFVLSLGIACGSLWAGGSAEAVTPETASDGYKGIEFADSEIRWKVDGENVRFQISAPTTGWVAIGFEPSRFMQDANIIIGYVRDGEVFISDQYGTSSFAHQADKDIGGTSDISDPAGSESGGRTNLEFTIPLDSGDDYDKPLTEGDTITMILAYGSDRSDDFSTKHAMRGSVRVPF